MNKKSTADIPLVTRLDLTRYLGTWYEIARLPVSFEKDLVGVTATYSLDKGNKVTVLNRGHKGTLTGPVSKAKGSAIIPDPQKPMALKVTFFWPFYGAYRIIALEEQNYSYAMIAGDTREYLWILCRTPFMDDMLYGKLVSLADGYGFDVDKLIKVPQNPDGEKF